ncbi:MAG: hypothetical protein QOJ40_1343 [Verrucomicrobiota bacterium]
MKNRTLWTWTLGLALTVPFAGGCVQEASSSTENDAPAIKAGTDSDVAVQSPADGNALAPEEAPQEDISKAAVRPVSSAKTPPPNLKVTPPVADIISLADSGMDESVMLAFVNKSTSTFNLRADEIIYLKDIGVPSSVMTAMIQRDEALREELTKASARAAAQTPELSYSGGVQPSFPEATSAQPQPDYATEPYVPSVSAPIVEPTYSNFYDSLAPYGSWVDVEGYGRCWQPTTLVVNSGWRPYFDGGRWVYTDCGWYWRSDYSWGWAPFHYGRWFRHQNLGWCWTPDTVWGPSWVSWRYNHDYCGWAPLPPRAHFRPGIGFASHSRGDFGLGLDSFSFIPFSHFRDHHLAQHALPHDQVSRIFNQTTLSTRITADHDRVINSGIAPEHVAAATRTEVPRLSVHDASLPNGRSLRADRPERSGSTVSILRPPLSARAETRANGELARPEIHSASPAIPRVTPARDSLIVIGRRDANTGRPLPPVQPNIHESRSWNPNQNSQQLTAMAAQSRSSARSPWAAAHSRDLSDGADRQQPVQSQAAPSFQSRLENRLSTREIAPQSQPMISRQLAPRYESPRYSPPPGAAPQYSHSAPAMESHAHSAPPSSSQGHSSSDRNSR